MLNDDQPAIPCGLVAKSFFNDTFKLFKVYDNDTRKEIDIFQKGIAWTSDVETKYKNVMPKNGKGTWQDI